MIEKPVGIVEPIGGHGGMDYYDYGLSMGVGNTGRAVRLYTCDATTVREFDNVKTLLIFKNLWKAGFIKKVTKYLLGHIKAFDDLKKNNGSIIHLHFFTFRVIDLIILLAAKAKGLKIVVTIHDVNAFDKRANGFVEKKCYALIDGLIVHNKSSYDVMIQKNSIKSPVSIIPHGNYLPFLNTIEAKRDDDRDFTILFFGQIKKVKGLDVLIGAVGKLAKEGIALKLVIAGKAWKSDLEEYVTMINNLNLNSVIETHFRYIPDEEVSEFYRKADLVILPYREIYQSGVLLLSMSYGVPILCSDLPPFKEIIEDGINGFIFESENVDSLKMKIEEIARLSPDLLTSISSASLKLMQEKYDWNKIGESTNVFYKRVEVNC